MVVSIHIETGLLETNERKGKEERILKHPATQDDAIMPPSNRILLHVSTTSRAMVL